MPSEKADVKWSAARERNPFRQWPVLVACFVCHVTTGSVSYHTGVLHVALLDTYHQDVVSTAWLGAVYSCLPSLIGPVASVLITMCDCRTCLVASGLLAGIGTSACYFVTSFPLMYPALIMAGIGQGFSIAASCIAIGYNFPRHANLLTGFCVCGSGLGIFIHPPLLQYLVDHYGLQGALLVIGALSFNAIPCGLAVPPSPYEIKRRRDRQKQRESVEGKKKKMQWAKSFWKQARTLTELKFLLFLLTALGFSAALSSYYLYLPDFLRHHRYDAMTASFVLSVTGMGSIPARLLTGVTTNDEKVDTITFFFSIFAVAALTTLLVPFTVTSVLAQMLLAAMFGAYTGAVWASFSPLLLELLGVERVATGVGLYLFTMGVGYLAGPPIAATIYTATQQFEHVFYFTAAMFCLACAGGMLSTLTTMSDPSDDQNTDHHDEELATRAALRFSLDVSEPEADAVLERLEIENTETIVSNGDVQSLSVTLQTSSNQEMKEETRFCSLMRSETDGLLERHEIEKETIVCNGEVQCLPVTPQTSNHQQMKEETRISVEMRSKTDALLERHEIENTQTTLCNGDVKVLSEIPRTSNHQQMKEETRFSLDVRVLETNALLERHEIDNTETTLCKDVRWLPVTLHNQEVKREGLLVNSNSVHTPIVMCLEDDVQSMPVTVVNTGIRAAAMR